MKDLDFINRFADKFVQGSQQECWEWTAAKAGSGYGVIRLSNPRRMEYAHRVMYEIEHNMELGALPSYICVCHECDNPSCVNPRHLFLGTHTDNMIDAGRKGRMRRAVKLTPKKVGEIKELLRQGMLHREIADKFGVSRPLITFIDLGKLWKDIE